MRAPADVSIRRQVLEDSGGVWQVIAGAFYAQPEVVALEEALAQRDDSEGYVGVVDGAVVGHVRMTRGWVDAEPRLVEVRYLSPLSVVPQWQRRGIGRALVAHAVAEAGRMAVPAVFLEGDPTYYGPLGWVAASDLGVTPPSARIPTPAFQAVPLPGWEPWMSGALVYADTFWALDVVGLRGARLVRARETLAAGVSRARSAGGSQ